MRDIKMEEFGESVEYHPSGSRITTEIYTRIYLKLCCFSICVHLPFMLRPIINAEDQVNYLKANEIFPG